MGMKSKLKMEIKEVAADGTFEGILSPYGNVDGGNDIVEPGAYTRTLKHHGSKVPLLWQHQPGEPIGQLTLEDRADGLWCKGQLLLDLPKAKEAYLLLKNQIIKGLSIGFESVKDTVEKGVRHLKEIRLYEGSIVTFPMNEQAQVTSVKQAGDDEATEDFNTELAEIQLQSLGYQMQNALRNALSGVLFSDLAKPDMVALSQTICQQFTEAYMAYLPDYLDFIEEEYGGMECWAKSHLELKATAKTKKVDGVDLTADCFAYVGDPEKTETWKLPIKFPGDDEKTKSHIRNALARFSLTEGIPESEKPKVLAKIHAAAKKYGIDVASDGKSGATFESKKGAMISAANHDIIETCCAQMKSATDMHTDAYTKLKALIADEPGSDATKSAEPATPKSDPLPEHSAIQTLIDEIRDRLN